jgi:hypothetical protein
LTVSSAAIAGFGDDTAESVARNDCNPVERVVDSRQVRCERDRLRVDGAVYGDVVAMRRRYVWDISAGRRTGPRMAGMTARVLNRRRRSLLVGMIERPRRNLLPGNVVHRLDLAIGVRRNRIGNRRLRLLDIRQVAVEVVGVESEILREIGELEAEFIRYLLEGFALDEREVCDGRGEVACLRLTLTLL